MRVSSRKDKPLDKQRAGVASASGPGLARGPPGQQGCCCYAHCTSLATVPTAHPQLAKVLIDFEKRRSPGEIYSWTTTVIMSKNCLARKQVHWPKEHFLESLQFFVVVVSLEKTNNALIGDEDVFLPACVHSRAGDVCDRVGGGRRRVVAQVLHREGEHPLLEAAHGPLVPLDERVAPGAGASLV